MAPLPPAALRQYSGLKAICLCALCAATALLTTSCSSNAPEPDPNAPTVMGGVTIPDNWQNRGEEVVAEQAAPTEAEAAGPQLAVWWRQFDDPVLDSLIAAALEGSPGIRTALSRIEESRARRGIALSPLLPTLNGRVTGSGSQRRDHENHTTTNSQNYTASLNMSWELDIFGKQQLALDAASADLLQTEENFYAAQVSLVAEVAEAYVQLRAAQAQLRVLYRNIAARAQTTELTLWRAQAGDVSEMEAQQAQSTLEQARAAIPSVEQNIALARNRLALLCGLAPGAFDSLLEAEAPVPVAPVQIAIGIPLETLRQRPDVRASEQALLAATFRTRSAERERLPSISLSASIGVEALRAGRLFSPEATAASLLGGLTAPLFQGGRIMETIAASEAQQQQAMIGYELVILTALSEVENALIGVRQNTDRLDILRRATASADMAATLAAQKYEAGQTDLLTVLEAQRTQLSLEEQAVNTSASLTTSHIQLYKAMGGGWTPLPVDGDASAEPPAIPADSAAGEAPAPEKTEPASAAAKASAAAGADEVSAGAGLAEASVAPV